MDLLKHHRPDRYDALAAALLAILIPLIFAPLINHLVRGTPATVPYSDHPAHNVFAAQMRQERHVTMPHPLYHVVLLATQRILHPAYDAATEPNAAAAIKAAGKEMQGEALAQLNDRYATASIVTLLLFMVLLGIVLWPPIRRAAQIQSPLGVAAGIPIILSLMLAAPIALLHPSDHDFYFGYIGLNVWHSPTIIAAKPFALLTFLLLLAAVPKARVPLTSRDAILLPLVLLLGALAKPSFLICLLPAATLLALYRTFVTHEPVRWRLLLAAVLLPAAIALAWQSHLYATLTGGNHARFAPFLTMSSMSAHLPLKFALSIFFPVACYLLLWPDARHRLRLNLAWLTFLIGAFFTYFIAETRRTAHGNFLWSAQLALFVLFVESMLLLLASWKNRRSLLLPALAALAFLPHLCFGILYYLHMLSTPQTVPLLYR